MAWPICPGRNVGRLMPEKRLDRRLSLALLLAGCAPDLPPCPPSTTDADGSPPPASTLYVGSGSPYERGALNVVTVDLKRCDYSAPVAMQIHAPDSGGGFPVVVFQHGFLLANADYSEMLVHVASHGFTVVAPQMYAPHGLPFGQPTIAEETSLLAQVIDWIQTGLGTAVGVSADATRLGLAGHSRGGKVVWNLLINDSTRALAVAGVDPVDGGFFGQQRIVNGQFGFSLPTLVMGAGQGSRCAPEGDNHEQFYQASSGPAWHVIVADAGHMDMLNDDLGSCGLICAICPVGADRAAMRELTAGMLTAFFRATLQGDSEAVHYLTDPVSAPMAIEVESR